MEHLSSTKADPVDPAAEVDQVDPAAEVDQEDPAVEVIEAQPLERKTVISMKQMAINA